MREPHVLGGGGLLLVITVLWILGSRGGDISPREPADGNSGGSSTSQSTVSPTDSSQPVQPDERTLRARVTEFVELFEAPASKGRSARLRALSMNEKAYLALNVQDYDTSIAGSAGKNVRVRVIDSPEMVYEETPIADDTSLVHAELTVVTTSPSSPEVQRRVQYDMVWIKDGALGWKFAYREFD